MRRPSLLGLPLLAPLGPLLLAACGSPTSQPAPSPTATALSGDAAKVAALSPGLRAGVLLRAIRDAGQPCQRVTGEKRVAAASAPATWIATCDDDHRWVVAITPDGTANVTDAKAIARLNAG